MTNEEVASMEGEARILYDSIHAIMKMSHYAFLKAVEEGFTVPQALEMSKQYMACLMNMGGKK